MNRFCKALSHLNSTQIDDKIEVLNKEFEKTGSLSEQPENSIGSLYEYNPPVEPVHHKIFDAPKKIKRINSPLIGNSFCKVMSHLNSNQINEKIKFLDKQLKKTRTVLESGPTMGTGNIYQTFRYDFTPELPEIEEYVPDSTGFTTGNSTQDANGGDESDSDTWENGWNNTNDMKNSNNLNGETNRIIPYTPDFSGWDGSGVSANNRGSGGYASIGIWTISSGLGGGKSIGTIDSTNHFIQILVPDNIFSSYNYPADQSGPLAGGYYGSYTDPEFAVAQSVAETYEDHKTASLWVSRKVWVNYDQATESSGPSYADYTGAKKQTTNASNGQPLYWKLKSVSVLAGARQNYISQTKRLESSTTTLLTQRSLDDPSVYPGNPDRFMDFLRGALDVGDTGLDYLNDKMVEEEVEELKSIENEATEEEKVDWQERMADLDETIERTASELKAARDEMKALALDFGMDVASVLGALATGGLSTVPAIIKTVGKKVGKGVLKKLLNKFKTKGQKKADRKDFAQRMRDEVSGKNTKKKTPDIKGTEGYFDSYKPQGKLISEGWESPKYTYVDKDQQKRWFKEKDVAPVYPKKAPPKMVKGWHPKFVVKLEKPIPVIKVSKKDLERSHTFKPDEVEELMQLVKNLNDYIKRNPDHLAYARVRYPKHDPRLAALNYKLDMQIAAADEYIETRFPENERLFDRLMRRTKESIKLTDPKTYDNNNGKLVTFNKLARIGNDYQPRKIKLKKKPKISQGKLFLLPDRKKKDDILKDKMAVLDKEIQKTMPEA